MSTCVRNEIEIKPIAKGVVHRICSGQVVLNLATAVKELVENSLDAGATVVDVRLRDYGSELVEVSDNGSGVHPDNFQALTLKHHTSKLQDFSDLLSVETFGFRGEALSSLCALSEVSVTTRHSSCQCGTHLLLDSDGIITSQTRTARQVGTTVTLKNIFSTIPVRQKEFQKNLKREFAKMVQLLTAYCLVTTDAKITCTNQTKKDKKSIVVATQSCKTVKENISSVFGVKQLNNLLEWIHIPSEEDKSFYHLDGLISSCAHGCGRSTTDRQFFYINSRPCEPSKLVRAVNEVYHQYNVHQNPFVFLNIKVPRNCVDVNVTPDKRKIFLDQEKLLIDVVKESLQNLYVHIPSTFTMNNLSSTTIKMFCSDVGNSNDVKEKFNNSSSVVTTNSTPSKEEINVENEESLVTNVQVDSGNEKVLQLDTTTKSDMLLVKTNDTSSSTVCRENTIQMETDVMVGTQHSPCSNDPEVDKVSSTDHSMIIEQPKAPAKTESSALNLILFNEWKCSEVTGKRFGDETSFGEAQKAKQLKLDNNVKLNKGGKLQGLFGSRSFESSSGNSEYSSNETSETVIEGSQSPCSSHNSNKNVISLSLDDVRSKQQRSIDEHCKKHTAFVRFRALIDPTKNSLAEQELTREISKDMFAQMEIIGQFNLGFIIARHKADLFIIDQHATDEKYNFETLQKTTSIKNQRLVVPQKLELTAVNESVLIENIEVFKANGFEFQIEEDGFPTERISLTAIPISKNWTFGKEDIDELIFMLQDSPHTLCRPSRVRAMFASRACRKSVMIGTALTDSNMKTLVSHMGEIEQPWNCPHGRPTMRHLINLDFYR